MKPGDIVVIPGTNEVVLLWSRLVRGWQGSIIAILSPELAAHYWALKEGEEAKWHRRIKRWFKREIRCWEVCRTNSIPSN